MLLADANPFTNFLQYLFLGLQKGAVYATIALALVIVFRVSGILNFAQGEMAMFSTFITWAIWDGGRVSIFVAIALSVVISFAMGAAIQYVVIRPVAAHARGNPLPIVIATIGLFLAFNALPPVLWGPNTKQFPTVFGEGSVRLFGASLTYQTIGTLVLLGAVVFGLYLLFQRTRVSTTRSCSPRSSTPSPAPPSAASTVRAVRSSAASSSGWSPSSPPTTSRSSASSCGSFRPSP
jgi:branched-chain amino acid transport system permease protein